MRRALNIHQQHLGPNHPTVATDLVNLSTLLFATNQLAEAETLMRRAVTIFENSLGSDHPNVSNALSNLAALFCVTDRLAEAEPLMYRVLEILLMSGPEGHPPPQLQVAINGYAGLLQKMGKRRSQVLTRLNTVCGPLSIRLGP